MDDFGKGYSSLSLLKDEPLDIIKIVLYESFQILILTQSICMILYYQLIHMMNIFLQNMFESELFSIQVDINIIVFVFIVCDLLVLISQLPPLLYILKMNTVQALSLIHI